MPHFKIEFEWNEDEETFRREHPTEKQAEEIYHEAEKVITQACIDRDVDLPTVAWLLVNDGCKKCGHVKTSKIIQ
jgi:hypothetical protein